MSIFTNLPRLCRLDPNRSPSSKQGTVHKMSSAGKPPPATAPAFLPFPFKNLGGHLHLPVTAPPSVHAQFPLLCRHVAAVKLHLQRMHPAPGLCCQHALQPIVRLCAEPCSEDGQGYRLRFPVRNQPLGAPNDKVCQGAEAPTDANRCLVLYPACLMCPVRLLAYSWGYRCSNSH